MRAAFNIIRTSSIQIRTNAGCIEVPRYTFLLITIRPKKRIEFTGTDSSFRATRSYYLWWHAVSTVILWRRRKMSYLGKVAYTLQYDRVARNIFTRFHSPEELGFWLMRIVSWITGEKSAKHPPNPVRGQSVTKMEILSVHIISNYRGQLACSRTIRPSASTEATRTKTPPGGFPFPALAAELYAIVVVIAELAKVFNSDLRSFSHHHALPEKLTLSVCQIYVFDHPSL